jgi:UDP-glucose 4-epimerase
VSEFESCLITGGAGFIGSHLADYLTAKGHRVTVLDDLSTGRRENLENVLDRPDFNFVVGDVTSGPTVEALVADADVVFHLASSVGVERVMRQGVLTVETSIRAGYSVLRAAEQHGAKVFITSSSDVYGQGVNVPFAESDQLVIGPSTQPRWAYAAAKLVDEFLALGYHRERGVPLVIARLFNVAGPRQIGRYGMVLPRFVAQALRAEDLTVYGDGTQTRTFCDVRDAVVAIERLASSPDAVGTVVNVGNDQELTILELARCVVEQLDSRSGIRHIPYEDVHGQGFEDILRRVPDLTRIRSLIDWQPSIPLSETIEAIGESLAADSASVV